VSAPVRPFDLGAMPAGRAMSTIDEGVVRAAPRDVYRIVADVLRWPERLAHYRFVRFRQSDGAGGGIVEMAANRPFGALNWPTWWLSEMQVIESRPAIRFRHIGGITTGMDVEWAFESHPAGTQVRLIHVWNGPRWPLIGTFAAVNVIGPVFIHGIASRTLAGLARAAESAGTST
jgi:ribosome-associated toxin RatA of RatAB toxin-antitoxin module